MTDPSQYMLRVRFLKLREIAIRWALHIGGQFTFEDGEEINKLAKKIKPDFKIVRHNGKYYLLEKDGINYCLSSLSDLDKREGNYPLTTGKYLV